MERDWADGVRSSQDTTAETTRLERRFNTTEERGEEEPGAGNPVIARTQPLKSTLSQFQARRSRSTATGAQVGLMALRLVVGWNPRTWV